MSRLSKHSVLRGSVGLLTRRAMLGAAPAALALGSPLLVARPARAAKQYGPGVIFFFQAEDGIRDATVTGVQTCALPIFATRSTSEFAETLFRATNVAVG